MCLCEHLGHVVYLFMFRDGFFFVNDRLHTAALYQSKKKLKVMISILTFFFLCFNSSCNQPGTHPPPASPYAAAAAAAPAATTAG